MNIHLRPFALFMVFLLTTAAAAAEPLVVELWPGKVPGDVGIKGEENSRIYQSAIIKGPTRLITNVTKPSMTIYSPPKDKNNGTAMLICPGGGYHDLFWELEGEEVAAWLNSRGMTGIILKYRCPRRPGDIKGEPPLILTVSNDAARRKALEARGAEVVRVTNEGEKTDLAAVARLLGERGFNEVTVETGAKLNGSLLRAGVVDELVIYYAPLLLGDKSQPMFALPEWTKLGEAMRLRVVDVRQIGPDVRVTTRFAS